MVIKLLIADDDALIREGLTIILGLDEEFDVVACVKNGLGGRGILYAKSS